MERFPAKHLEGLANRIFTGEVIFFIGAGFSVDSERNTADRLIARLAVRFEAITACLSNEAAASPDTAESPAATAAGLRESIFKTFSLSKPAGVSRPLLLPENLKKLTGRYFDTNDWMCSAYQLLLGAISQLSPPALKDFCRCLRALEKRLLRGFQVDPASLQGLSLSENVRIDLANHRFLESGWEAEMESVLNSDWGHHREHLTQAKRLPPLDTVPLRPTLRPLGLLDLEKLKINGGKALFLDTMGFADRRIMGGQLQHTSVEKIEASYVGKLLPRHRILARFAREGFSKTLVTTNYDLLMEGAFRLAGMSMHTPGLKQSEPVTHDTVEALLPKPACHRFVRIADALQFFDHCGDAATAQILKIHGCVDSYRTARLECPRWREYLPAMVFTYREIQNWRNDSWSRDLLRTLLRSRTFAFCGYGGTDHVIHDTCRTVYEEMARRRTQIRQAQGTSTGHQATGLTQAGKPAPSPQAKDSRDASRAPAFFFGGADSLQFHGLELLRAATQALGLDAPGLADHPNYVPFFFRDDKEKCFPSLDETLLWLYHRVFRQAQARALETDLARIASTLMGHPCALQELERIRQHFRELCDREADQATHWTSGASERHSFEKIVSWTDGFHTSLLREFALGEVMLRHHRPGLHLQVAQCTHWYYPASEQPGWTAWGAVLELALRRLIAVWRGKPATWLENDPFVQVRAAHGAPTILFSNNERFPAPTAISVRLCFFEQDFQTAAKLAVKRHLVWQLHPKSLPWGEPSLTQANWRDSLEQPSAEQVWTWAHRDDLLGLNPITTQSFLGPPT